MHRVGVGLRIKRRLFASADKRVLVHQLVLDGLTEIFLDQRVKFAAQEGLAGSVRAVHLLDRRLAQKLNDIERCDVCPVSLDEVEDFVKIAIMGDASSKVAFWVGQE